MKKSRQISLQECYDILLLDKDATLEDVKKSYRKRAFELHPDLNPDVADASQQFQRLNEAYVALSQILQTEESERKTEAKKEEKKQQDEDKKSKGEQKSEQKSKQNKEKTSKKTEEKAKQESQSKAEANRQRKASAAYAKEDVLRDLLHDPFARRVFEDIYSEVSKQAKPEEEQKKPTPPSPPPPPPNTPTVNVDLGDSKNITRLSNKFSGKIMGWFRHQIDEEQSIKMPPQALFPGSRIRLQIRRGLSEELTTIEIVLPKDFVIGKPIRLRGLGKKVGKWQGDLYLILESNQKVN